MVVLCFVKWKHGINVILVRGCNSHHTPSFLLSPVLTLFSVSLLLCTVSVFCLLLFFSISAFENFIVESKSVGIERSYEDLFRLFSCQLELFQNLWVLNIPGWSPCISHNMKPMKFVNWGTLFICAEKVGR